MKTALECIPCFARQAAEAVTQTVSEPDRREKILRTLLRAISDADWNGSPPEMGQRIHRLIRQELGCNDPYREIKQRMNRMTLQLLPHLRESMARQPDLREAAVRLAIAGNLLDAGAKTQMEMDALPRFMETIWTRPLHGDAAALFHAAERAARILYLADNAGEIIFDRADLIIAKGQGNYETLSESPRQIFFLFVVKCPVIATRLGAPIGTLVAGR